MRRQVWSPAARPSPEAGLSMIEVLVTVIVVAVGLLGLAGLQNVVVKNTHSSYLMSTANNMAYDIADRMRANREAATGGRYNIDFGEDPDVGGVAGNDLSQWLGSLDNALPTGEGRIRVQSDGTAVIRVRWVDNRSDRDAAEGSDKTTTVTFRTRL